MRFNTQNAFRFALNSLLLAVVLAVALSSDFYASTMASAFLSLALFSAVIVLVMLRKSWIDMVWVMAGALALAFLDYRLMEFKPKFMAGFSFLGMAAFTVLGTRTIWGRTERKLLLGGFLPVILFVGSEWMASTLLDITERLHPKTFDLFLYSFDGSLHIQLSFLVGQIFWAFPWLRALCLVVYLALPLPLALVYAAQLKRGDRNAMAVMLAFLVTGPAGVLLYNVLPACGPIHLAGPAFPWHPLATADAIRMILFALPVAGPRNAIPSLHMTWVLLVWWNSRGLRRWIRAIALAFVWLTALATLGTGEHYFVDLIVALPFSLMIQALCSYSLPLATPERRTAFLFGTSATLLWLALLSFGIRFFWISPIIPWTMATVTIASSVLLWRRLIRADLSGTQAVPARLIAAAAGAAN